MGLLLLFFNGLKNKKFLILIFKVVNIDTLTRMKVV